jgi:hypothetical protein
VRVVLKKQFPSESSLLLSFIHINIIIIIIIIVHNPEYQWADDTGAMA